MGPLPGAYGVLLGGAFLLDRVLRVQAGILMILAALGVAARVFDCMFTARRMARREESEERSLSKCK